LRFKARMYVASSQRMQPSTLKHWLVVLGVFLFFSSLAVLFVAVRNYWAHFSTSTAYLFEIPFLYWVAIALAAATYYLLDFCRLYTLLKLLGTRLSVLDGLRALSIAEVASFLVPTGVLYVPTAIFVLKREGVNTGDATAAVVTRTVYSIVWVSFCGFIALFFARERAVPGVLSSHFIIYLLPVVGIILLFITLVVFAPRLHRWIQGKVLSRFRSRRVKALFQWFDRTEADIGTIGHSTSPYHFLSHLSSIGMILMYSFMGFVLAHATGLELSMPGAICIFSISLLLIDISPMSGTIGVSEAATAYLLNQNFGPREIFVAVALRIIARYVLLVPGFILLLFAARNSKLGT
jgi:uncharacterized membrane protein YbhN (UPF0104 family)